MWCLMHALLFLVCLIACTGATYRVDLSEPIASSDAKHVPKLFKRAELKVPHDPADYETKQARLKPFVGIFANERLSLPLTK